MPLHVIGGEARGRRLRSPPAGVRPTSAILRRSLFDILGARVTGARVLDLYAGAGTLGIEALSRGAASAQFVDRDRRCANVIAANLALAGIGAQAEVDCARAGSWIEHHRDRLGEFDLVFIDPPYGDAGLQEVLELLSGPGGITGDALVVVEESRRSTPSAPASLELVRLVRHGDSTLTLLRRAR